jgi:non-ribosomal peptide synthetase component F
MEWNIADLVERIVDLAPDREALVCGDQRRSYAQLEERSNRLAHHLASVGIGPGDHVGIYASTPSSSSRACWAPTSCAPSRST